MVLVRVACPRGCREVTVHRRERESVDAHLERALADVRAHGHGAQLVIASVGVDRQHYAAANSSFTKLNYGRRT